MTQTNESTTAPTEQEVSTIQGWATQLTDVEPRLGPYCARAESRPRALLYLDGLLRPAERNNSWQVAAICGEPTPYGFQYWLGRAAWDADAVRDARRTDVLHHLGDPHGVLVLAETGWVKTGCHAAGVARQYTGTVGKGEHCQIGGCLGDAGQRGHALVDRELSMSQAWANDRERCRQAGIPADRPFAPKPQRARQLLAGACAAGVPATWVTGDRVQGADRRLRVWLEARPPAQVRAVSGQEQAWLGWRQQPVQTILAALPPEGWTRLSAGDGGNGPRWYDGRGLPLAEPQAPGWRRWRLVQRRRSVPTELTADRVFAPQDTTVAEVVQVAGTRGTIASRVEAATGEVGLDDQEVRRWTGWQRPSTLARWADALVVILRTGTMAVAAFKKRPPPGQERSRLAAFQAQRGLASR